MIARFRRPVVAAAASITLGLSGGCRETVARVMPLTQVSPGATVDSCGYSMTVAVGDSLAFGVEMAMHRTGSGGPDISIHQVLYDSHRHPAAFHWSVALPAPSTPTA